MEGSVTIEGVSFNVEICSKMTLPEFKKRHSKDFWKDRTSAERDVILEKAYGIITKSTTGRFLG